MSSTTEIRSKQAAEIILEEVRRRGLQLGDKIPTERKFSSSLGLTRATVRNAMALLDSQGIVSREVGRGTFLKTYNFSGRIQFEQLDPSMTSLKDVSPSDVISVRLLIEPQSMALAVGRATVYDLEEIDRCIKGGDSAESYEEFESWDLALHRAFIEASHNPLLIRIYAAIEAARHGELWGDLKRRSHSKAKCSQYQCEHKAIAAALRNRNSSLAIDAMYAHLQNIEQTLNLNYLLT